MALLEISCRYPQACPRQLWATTTPNGSLGRHWSFPPVIHPITNDDWRNMPQRSIIALSPPTLTKIGFNPPSVGRFFQSNSGFGPLLARTGEAAPWRAESWHPLLRPRCKTQDGRRRRAQQGEGLDKAASSCPRTALHESNTLLERGKSAQ